jgi:hypothetical protein
MPSTGSDNEGGNGKDNFVDMLAGDDTYKGRGGNDTIYGGAGNDSLSGNGGSDEIYGDGNDDRLFGKDGNDSLYGGNGIDKLDGGANDDVLHGGANDDLLIGRDGNDTLNGGAGNDVLKGEAGLDTFEFDVGSGIDKIKGFENGSDKIDLTAYFDEGITSISDLKIKQLGTKVQVKIDPNTIIVLLDTDLADIDATDFVFATPPSAATITFDGGVVSGSTYTENDFTASLTTFAFQTTAQNPLQDLDGDGDLDFGVTDESSAVTGIDAFAFMRFTQDNGDTFDFVSFDVVAEGGTDLDGNLLVTADNSATGYGVTATLSEAGNGLWDVDVSVSATSGYVGYTDLTQAEMLAYFEDVESVYIRSADGDGRNAVDTGNGIGFDNLEFA